MDLGASTDPPSRPASSGAVAPTRGVLRLAVGAVDGASRLRDLHEAGGLRLRFPHRMAKAPLEAITVNTAGGLVAGDTITVATEIGDAAEAVVTSQAAERVYRSAGPVALVRTSLRVRGCGRLAWLPQETILYDRASLVRRTEIALDPNASLLLCDMLVFGRHAMGETVREGRLDDRWSLRLAGRLVWHEPFRLEGSIDRLLARPAITAGARAIGSLLACGPAFAGRLDAWRDAVTACGVRAAAGRVRGLLRARLFAATGGELKAAVTRLLATLAPHTGPLARVPRAWAC